MCVIVIVFIYLLIFNTIINDANKLFAFEIAKYTTNDFFYLKLYAFKIIHIDIG